MRDLLCLVLTIYTFVLFLRVILSYVEIFVRPVPDWLIPIIRGTAIVTEPVLRPVRGVIPPLRIGAAALDVSILIVFILLGVLRGAIC